MTAYAVSPYASALEGRSHGRRPRIRVYAVQTPAARARRRAVARGALVTVILAFLAAVAPGAIAGDQPGPAVVHDTYTVSPGETLWSIASSMTGPGEQVRETMSEIKALNAMSGSSLQAGAQIAVPALDR